MPLTDHDPIRLSEPSGRREEPPWKIGTSFACPAWSEPPRRDFAAVINSRRSMRQLSQAPISKISNVLTFSLMPTSIATDDPWSRARGPVPSGGAIHAIEALVIRNQSPNKVFWFNARDAQMCELLIADEKSLCEFVTLCREILPSADGAFVVLLGDILLSREFYMNPESLLWREAGAIMQTLLLAAEAYELGACPMGINGNQVAAALGVDHTEWMGLGVLAMGRVKD